MTARAVLLIEEGGVGGVADYTAELAGALAREGWAVRIATAVDHAYPEQPGVRIHRLFYYARGEGAVARLIRSGRLSRVVNGLTHLLADLPLLAIARRCEIAHVQGGEWPPLGLVQAWLLRAAGVTLVWTPHNVFDRGAVAYARSRTATARCAAAVVLHAEHDLTAVPASLRPRCVIIPHGEYGGLGRRGAFPVPAEPVPRQRSDEDDALAVLLFGQLREDKGVRDLLTAAAETGGVRVSLVGEDKGALGVVADLLADPRLAGRVRIREGFLPIDAAPAQFAACDVVCLPYHQASASGVMMLAYGYGRPVIAYPVGGLPEYVVDGETGWLCTEAKPSALAVTLAAARDAGPAEWVRRGAAALALAQERYSWDAVARRTVEVYARARSRRGARRI